MAKIAAVSLVRGIPKFLVVGGCLLSILWGCSSRLQTTILSKSEPETPQVAQVQQADPPVEEVVMQPIKVESAPVSPPPVLGDIPLEGPAPTKIFATPKTEVSPSLIPALPEAVSEVEPVPPPSDRQVDVLGIPPADFEPELPATPSPPIDTPTMPELIAEQEPIQIAKVVQPVPEDVVIVEEDLVQALGDVFFDYDRFTIREDAVPALTNNANLLTASLADTKIVIEGHCDERGTRSYNMILGERRAQAVKTYLEDLGVPADNLQVVSYGKDKPFCMEQSQECWQENRRGHFILK